MKTYNPKITVKEMHVVASAILMASHHNGCDMSWDTLLAVSLRESSWRKDPPGSPDVGIMQFSQKTITRLGLNRNRLVKDAHYSIQEGCQLLTTNMKTYSKTRSYWIGVYNSGINFSNPEIVRKAKAYDLSIKKLVTGIRKRYAKLYLSDIYIAHR